jgi:hypothetical protein
MSGLTKLGSTVLLIPRFFDTAGRMERFRSHDKWRSRHPLTSYRPITLSAADLSFMSWQNKRVNEMSEFVIQVGPLSASPVDKQNQVPHQLNSSRPFAPKPESPHFCIGALNPF